MDYVARPLEHLETKLVQFVSSFLDQIRGVRGRVYVLEKADLSLQEAFQQKSHLAHLSQMVHLGHLANVDRRRADIIHLS